MLSIIRDNARSGGGEGAHVLLGGGGLAFLGLESSKEEEVGRARNRQGVGRLVLRAAHTTISHFFFFFFFGNLSTCERKNQPSLEMYFRILSCSEEHRDTCRYMAD